jgi:hypothetical protein
MTTNKLKDVDPEVIKELKSQILKELDNKDVRARERLKIQREKDLEIRTEYVDRMKNSSDPWMELIAISIDKHGEIRIELEWNDAFIKELRKNGFTGPDDNTIMQRYVAVLAKNVSEDMFDMDGGD